MALSKSEQKTLEKLLEKQKAEEYEPPQEVAFEIGGAKVWIPYPEAKRFLKREGIDLDEVLQEEGDGEEDDEEGDEEEDEEGEEEEEENPEGELSRIPRKRPAKKVTPPVEDTRTKSQKYFRKNVS